MYDNSVRRRVLSFAIEGSLSLQPAAIRQSSSVLSLTSTIGPLQTALVVVVSHADAKPRIPGVMSGGGG